ncbi:MAG: MFS transporter [Flavobacteriales bacterium]|nr:MFS transporter [Flavobacteriales bacterium]
MLLVKGDKKVINAWAFYDWANSVYALVITTAIFPIFFDAVTDDNLQFFGVESNNMELYSYTISFSFLVVSILSPLLSGVADYAGNKKYFLKSFCLLGSVSTGLLYFFSQEYLELSLLIVVMASVGFWGSIVFYNAYLPEIAEPKDHDKVSAKGYAMGYIGSSILLIFILIAYMGLGMDIKWSFPIVGVWWFGFAQITYRKLPQGNPIQEKESGLLSKGFKELQKVWEEIKPQKRLKTYLLSFFVFSMGVQTVMQMATLFGIKEIDDMPDSGMIISILIIQFVAVGGSYLFSYLSSKLGNIKALGITLIIWIGICIAAYFTHKATEFYILAGVVGLVMGGVQSLSRSTYSKLLPQTKDTASYFSFYDVTEKIGVVIGTFAFGTIVGFTGSMRNSVFALLLFFVAGLLILAFIPREKVAKNG